MRILNIIEGYDSTFGGHAESLHMLMQAIPDAEVLAPRYPTHAGVQYGAGEARVHTYINDGLTRANFSRSARRFLRANSGLFDIYHIHGLWQYICHAGCKTARRASRPYVVSPRGMLYGAALAERPVVKRLFRTLWFNRDLSRSTCIHVTSHDEMRQIRTLGYTRPIAVIPNIIADNEDTREAAGMTRIFDNHSITLGYVGRLHPRKGVDILLRAAARHRDRISRIIIVGDGDGDYTRSLIDLSARLGISPIVEMAGHLTGTAKWRAVARMDAMVAASDFESFGRSVAECMLCARPVITTTGTPWQHIEPAGMGWCRPPTVDDIADAIGQLTEMDARVYFTTCNRARDFILYHFSSERIASQTMALYHWLDGSGPTPDTLVP